MFIKKARCQWLGHWPDEELVQAYYHTGKQQYLSELFSRHVHRLYQICHSFLKDREKSKDMVMLVFEKMITELPEAHFKNFNAWLFKLTRNMCISSLRVEERQLKRHQSYLALILKDEPTVENGAEVLDSHHSDTFPVNQLHHGLARLPAKQRKCIELFFFKKKSYREITEETGYSLKEVKSFLQNGKRRLRRYLLSKP